MLKSKNSSNKSINNENNMNNNKGLNSNNLNLNIISSNPQKFKTYTLQEKQKSINSTLNSNGLFLMKKYKEENNKNEVNILNKERKEEVFESNEIIKRRNISDIEDYNLKANENIKKKTSNNELNDVVFSGIPKFKAEDTNENKKKYNQENTTNNLLEKTLEVKKDNGRWKGNNYLICGTSKNIFIPSGFYYGLITFVIISFLIILNLIKICFTLSYYTKLSNENFEGLFLLKAYYQGIFINLHFFNNSLAFSNTTLKDDFFEKSFINLFEIEKHFYDLEKKYFSSNYNNIEEKDITDFSYKKLLEIKNIEEIQSKFKEYFYYISLKKNESIYNQDITNQWIFDFYDYFKFGKKKVKKNFYSSKFFSSATLLLNYFIVTYYFINTVFKNPGALPMNCELDNTIHILKYVSRLNNFFNL